MIENYINIIKQIKRENDKALLFQQCRLKVKLKVKQHNIHFKKILKTIGGHRIK